MSHGHLPLVRGHRQSGVRLQRSPNTERCLPSLGDHCLFYCCFARSCSPLSQVRTVFDRSRFTRHLDGRLLHYVPRRLHSWTRYSLVCCLSVPSCKLPPVVVSSPRVHRRCLGNHPSATFFRQRLTFTRFPRGKYLDFCSSKKLTNVTLWTRFWFLPCFGKL